MRVLVTGANGFIGKNLVVRLEAQRGVEILRFVRGNSLELLRYLVGQADAIVHLAGENRPRDGADFERGNAGLTRELCAAVKSARSKSPIVFASSIQAAMDNPYGASKRAAEEAVEKLAAEGLSPIAIYRLPNVFGKWCKPEYNSVVATFCHNIANDLPIRIVDPAVRLRLAYIDDVASAFAAAILRTAPGLTWDQVGPEYNISLGELAGQIEAFRRCRINLISERVGAGLARALYATYVSYLPPTKFVYALSQHQDSRGTFVEMLKTQDSGQFSFFTAHPGMTRGGHYHHTKTEKFLVIKGIARFGFRHIVSGQTHQIIVKGVEPQIVDTVPGWTHDITNIGDDDLVVMLWANEIFDRTQPDTIPCKVQDETA
jgi:UDP-2-acetamido-2,6-beta-L-arabino-hexul-4-ose reductase